MAGQSSAEGQSTDQESGAAAQERALQQPAGQLSADQLTAPVRPAAGPEAASVQNPLSASSSASLSAGSSSSTSRSSANRTPSLPQYGTDSTARARLAAQVDPARVSASSGSSMSPFGNAAASSASSGTASAPSSSSSSSLGVEDAYDMVPVEFPAVLQLTSLGGKGKGSKNSLT